MIDVLVPEEQEGTKAVVRAWLRQVGDRVEVNDPLVELETDKVAMEVPAPAAGVLREILLHTDDDAVPGAILGRIAPTAEEAAERSPAEAGVQPKQEKPGPRPSGSPQSSTLRGAPSPGNSPQQREARLSPSVKRAVLQHDLNPDQIEGTGRGGRITRADVDRAIGGGAPVEGVIAAATGDISSHFVPHDRMRLTIAENMQRSLSEAPHVTAVFEADFSAIVAHREAHKAAFGKKGAKLTYTAYIVAAAAEAMKTAPAINSRWHADRLELYDDVNIGVGTALGAKGLIVPVLRKVQQLSLKGIAAQLDELIEKARKEKLTAADIRGGTFTISNHGVSGSLFAAPIIINQPQSAILGVGKLEKRVVVRHVAGQDAIQIRPMAYVSLTIDHRVVDGHQTNAWLSRFVELLEKLADGLRSTMGVAVTALLSGLLAAAQPGQPLVTVPCAFSPAFFEVNSARMTAYTARSFAAGYLSLFRVFDPDSRARITLMGIATDGGSDRANRRLARQRAEAVRRYLIARGVRRDRVRIVTRHAGLEEWPLSSTHGRAVVVDVEMPSADLMRLMPPEGPIC